MKRLIITFAIGVSICAPASAQMISECQQVKKPTARLACYDKIAPPITAKAVKANAESKKSDAYTEEEQRMKKVLAPICRNC